MGSFGHRHTHRQAYSRVRTRVRMLGLSSIFLITFFYMYFASRPRPALTAVHPELCDCTSDSKVPDAWGDFLLDQRGPRKQGLAGVKRRRLKLEESRRGDLQF